MENLSKSNDKCEDRESNKTQEHQNNSNSLLLQLHEQYAINNNANLSSVITIIVAAIAVIGVYGYVFVHSTLCFTDFGNLYNSCTDLYSLDVLLLSSLTSILIVLIFICVCFYQGVAQRKEQFIIHAIRVKMSSKLLTLLPDRYNPFLKFGFKIVQGLYGEIIKFFICTILFIVFTTAFKLTIHVYNNCSNDPNWFFISETFIVLILLAFALFMTYRYCINQLYSYIIRQAEYGEYMEPDKLKTIIETIKIHESCKTIFIKKMAIVRKYNQINNVNSSK